jgi:Transport inhibitor response 1 protein domain/F-box
MKKEISNMTDEDDACEQASVGGSLPPSSDEAFKKALENVLEFLTSKRDRNAASAVCRSWYDTDARTRRELFIGNCYAVSPDRVVERFKSIKSIVLKGKPRFADFNLVPYGWGANFTPWVNTLGDAYQHLESISLKRMVVTDENLMSIADNFPLFKDLSLVCCEGFSTLGLAAIAERCRYWRVKEIRKFFWLIFVQ